MTRVFVDSGYLIALEAVGDQHHDAAVRYWPELRRRNPQLVTTSFVLDEVLTYFISRARHAKAVEIGRRLLGSASVRVVHVDEDLFHAAFAYLERRPDKRFSLTDCVSFVLMERLGISHALAFDAHFVQAGFSRLPADT